MKDDIEAMADISSQDLEAIKNISSIMNNGKGTLTDLDITNNANIKKLTITDTSPTATTVIGNIQLNNKHTGFANEANSGKAEISSDSDVYKKLMILGNKSAGGSRQVGIWDDVSISSNLNIGNETKSNSLNVANDGYISNILFNKKHTGFSNDKNDGSEISNDTSGYKGLMLVGNKSKGDNRRRVLIYDDLIIPNGRICADIDCNKYIKFVRDAGHPNSVANACINDWCVGMN